MTETTEQEIYDLASTWADAVPGEPVTVLTRNTNPDLPGRLVKVEGTKAWVIVGQDVKAVPFPLDWLRRTK